MIAPREPRARAVVRRRLQALVLLVLVLLALGASYTIHLARTYGYGERLIALHLCVLGATIAASLAVVGAVARLAGLRAAALAALAPMAAVPAAMALYAVNVVSHRSWGHTVTYDLALQYLPRPSILLSYVPLVADNATVAAVVGVMLGGAWLARPRVLGRGTDALCERLGGCGRGLASLGAAAVGCMVLAGAVVVTTPRESRAALLAREPFIGFFLTQRQYEFVESRMAIRHRHEGPAARAAYRSGMVAPRRHVALIVVDSLRADHMQVYGYPRETTPFLDDLRRSGRLRAVRRAVSSCAESNCGISSVLSSKTLGSTVPENFKLHDLLRDVGYRLHFILSGKHDWFGLREFYGREMQTYFDGTTAALHAATDDRVVLEGLASVPPADHAHPAFFHIHLMSTHQIGFRLKEYEAFLPALPHGRPDASTAARINGYDNGVLQADGIIRQVFDTLQAKGYLDGALVMIVADHGESLGSPGEPELGHGPSLGHEALNIPWLIVDDEFAAYRNLEFGVQADVAPTIVSRLGLPVPAAWEGRSLLEHLDERITLHYSNFAGRSAFAVMQARGPSLWKLIQSREGEALYDLVADPHEERDLLPVADRSVVSSLRAALAARVAPIVPTH
jgi:hypothetical protein